MLDEEGTIKESYLQSAYGEATLTTELSPFFNGMKTLFESNPFTQPFFMFARTGINGVAMTAKNMPILGALMNKQRAILSANPKNADHMMDLRLNYGIETAEDLAAEKSLIIGRQAIGVSVVYMANQMWMAGNLRGTGPVNRQERNFERDLVTPTSIRLGDVWVDYNAMEPFNQLITFVADVNDLSTVMGPEWTENALLLAAGTIASATFSKSYLAGIESLVDLFSGEPYQAQSIIANLMNNTVPLAGLRNDIGKMLAPQMREPSSFWGIQLETETSLLSYLPVMGNYLTDTTC